MKIRDLMIEDIPKADVKTSVLDACKLMLEKHVTGVAVYQHGAPIGMVTERTLLRKFVPLNKLPNQVTCKEIMVPILKISPEESVRNAVELLIKNGRTRVGIYDKEKFLGWVLLPDLVPYVMKRDLISLFSHHGMDKEHDIMCPVCESEFLVMTMLQNGTTVRWECPKCGHTE